MEPLNREQRRHPEKLDQAEQPGHETPKQDPGEDLARAERTPDDLSVRAKNTGHKKKTADKWNQ
jgi:hypothetical protein